MSILDAGETATESEFKAFLQERLPEINTAVNSYNYSFEASATDDTPELSTYYQLIIGDGAVGAGPYAGYISQYAKNSAGTRKSIFYLAGGWFSDNAGVEYGALDIFMSVNGNENFNIISVGWFATWDVASVDDTTFPNGWSNNMRLYSATFPCVLWGTGSGGDGHGIIGYDNGTGSFELSWASDGGTVTANNDIFINPFYGAMSVGNPTGGVGTTRGIVNVFGDVKKNNTAYTNPDYALEHYFNGSIVRFKDNPGAADYKGILPLEELEGYLIKYLHLPGNFGQTQGIFDRADLVLEKMEEAWLYIIELYKRVRVLEGK